jgi:Class III cytochrome C family
VKGRWIVAIIAANLVALVGLAFAYPHLMVSPGALVPAHAALATDCFACHTPLRGASAERCVACHTLPDIGLRTTKGVPMPKPTVKASFHQQLIVQNCMACHSDHEGPKLTQHSRKLFSHELLRADVRERCESCHMAPTDTMHRQIQGNCAQCHKPQAWKPASFEHDKLFLLDGDHNATCVTCHVDNDYSRYTCFGCHEHTPSNIRAKHEKEGIRNFENCVACHRSASEGNEREGRGEGRKKD